jgi:hypothetical protein
MILPTKFNSRRLHQLTFKLNTIKLTASKSAGILTTSTKIIEKFASASFVI